MPIDVFDYLKQLDQERFRAVILHSAPDKSPALTRFCQKICKQTNSKYLDLLELFIQTETLNKSIDTFTPEKLKGLLIEQCPTQSLLIVDHVDFLLDTWRKADRDVFYRIFKEQWDGYKDGMSAKLLICLQTSQGIETVQMADSFGQSRIFQLTDFNDIL